MTREELLQRIHFAGLSRIAPEICDLAWDSIRFTNCTVQLGNSPLGASHIGGAPDLPRDMVWPEFEGTPMSFVAQINFAEVSPYSTRLHLPSSGLLYLFYGGEGGWGYDLDHRRGWRVLYHEEGVSRLAHVPIPDQVPRTHRFAPCTLDFSRELTLPNCESYWIETLDLNKEELTRYMDLLDQVTPWRQTQERKQVHRLVGHPDQIQGDMQLECQLVSHGIYCGNPGAYNDPRTAILKEGASNWRLLLQVDSNENAGMVWGDAGKLYCWIRQDELEKRDFGQSWLILQSY